MISLRFQKDQSNFCVKNGLMGKNRSRKTSWEATAIVYHSMLVTQNKVLGGSGNIA